MKKVFLFLIIVFTTFSLSAQNDVFSKANTLYSQGKYDEAISLYKELLKDDKHATAIYFNLGNSYYQKKEIAAAILSYERAKLLSPSNKEVQENLDFVNAQIYDKIKAKPQYFIIKWLRKLINRANSNTWAYIVCGLWIILFISLFLFIRSRNINLRKTLFPLMLIVFLSSIFSLYATYAQYEHEKYNKYAIVLASSATAQSTPSINGTELFILHEGTKVKIIEKVGSWYNIQLADDRQGWLPTKDIERIVTLVK